MLGKERRERKMDQDKVGYEKLEETESCKNSVGLIPPKKNRLLIILRYIVPNLAWLVAAYFGWLYFTLTPTSLLEKEVIRINTNILKSVDLIRDDSFEISTIADPSVLVRQGFREV